MLVFSVRTPGLKSRTIRLARIVKYDCVEDNSEKIAQADLMNVGHFLGNSDLFRLLGNITNGAK